MNGKSITDHWSLPLQLKAQSGSLIIEKTSITALASALLKFGSLIPIPN
jgi:hypothetical protein